jgi:hypothetical protein
MLHAIAIIQHRETHGLLSYPIECAWYWGPMSVVHAALFVVGVLCITALALWSRGHFRRRCRRWAIFNVCFFLTAGLVNGLWSCLVFGHLYWTTDYVFDFTPFWPVTQSLLDARFGDQVGGLLGISLFQLQALWLLFAISAWLGAFTLYRVCRNLGFQTLATAASNQAMQRTAVRSDG